jgi:hypothetical protein
MPNITGEWCQPGAFLTVRFLFDIVISEESGA